ncbi:hsp70-binding protein 1-like isoform X2 [Dinothrombium tinctorium]|uniref:Hsp70-binding protein 1-like isoform X2 n=1 Tax=Dinothrombium tinctorium TaxID=1965070 RepID=A0A3S3PC79_9ACAR|nr:hsp70-binding protein 1-like isoform X2 [Dinothrombium tinctorium]
MSEDELRARNLRGLLQFCVEQTAREDNTSSNAEAMSEERRQWLSQVIGSIGNQVEQMKQNVDIVKSFLNSGEEHETDEVIEAIDNLIDIVAQIDYANDFHKIGGFEILAPLISCNNSKLQIKGCDLLAEIVQNNKYCQKAVVDYKLLPLLVSTLDTDPDEEVRIKALYAISCLLRGNEDIQSLFESQFDGFSVLLRSIQQSSTKLRIKTSFLLTSLCQQQPRFKEALWKMGFVEQIIAILHQPHNETHEFLLSALYALVSEHEPSRKECQRSELKFESLLRSKLQQIKDRDECKEEIEYCEKLLLICFNNDTQIESER